MTITIGRAGSAHIERKRLFVCWARALLFDFLATVATQAGSYSGVEEICSSFVHWLRVPLASLA